MRAKLFLVACIAFVLVSIWSSGSAFAETVTLNPSQDAYVNSHNSLKNFGSELSLQLSYVEDESSISSYIWFDLSSIPQGSVVTKATLQLYLNDFGLAPGSTANMKITKVTRDWGEQTITFAETQQENNFGSPDAVASADISNDEGYKTWDITTLVQNWISGTDTNYGVRLFTKINIIPIAHFYSREGMYPPQLIVEYTPPIKPDQTPPTIKDIKVTSIAKTSTTIIWMTDEAADGYVEYGRTKSYGSKLGTSLKTTRHSVFIPGLNPGRQYHYRVVSKDAAGNRSASQDKSFWTTKTSGPGGKTTGGNNDWTTENNNIWIAVTCCCCASSFLLLIIVVIAIVMISRRKHSTTST